MRRAVEQAGDHPPLAVAEFLFAEAFEDFRHRAAGGQLDLGVGVAERQTETGGKAAADGGFAGPHKADQYDAAAGECAGQSD